jgi:3-hydroxyacyl-[acyl-carrier-protein] dehydratase
MLKDDFFKILTLENTDAAMKVVLELNAGHEIFKGHFPGKPVVPGVCMMQMVKELVQLQTIQELRLARADYMKFLVVVDPVIQKVVSMTLVINRMVESIDVLASLSAGETVCFKFKGTFVFA